MRRCYRTFEIPKRNGKVRTIKDPYPPLKQLQKELVAELKQAGVVEHEAAHGFKAGHGCRSCVAVHQDNHFFLKIDLHDFFPTISRQMVAKALRKEHLDLPHEPGFYAWYFTDTTNHLTQGSPSSPFIANIVLKGFDKSFTNWCNKRELTYTRYADDMLISSDRWFRKESVIETVKAMLPQFTLAEDKTAMGTNYAPCYHLGMNISNDNQIKIGWRKKKQIQHIAYLDSIGELTPAEHNHWKGMLNWYSAVEPDYFRDNPRFDSLRRWAE